MKNAFVTILKSAGILVVGIVFYAATAIFSGSHYEIPPNDTVPANAISTPTPAPTMLQMINAQRTKVGKPVLVEDPKLDTAAAAKVAAMIQYNTFTHQMPNGEPIFKYLGQQYQYWTNAGENLVEHYNSQPEAVNAWVGSPGHYAIMTGNYDAFGWAQAFDTKANCWVAASYYIKYYR